MSTRDPVPAHTDPFAGVGEPVSTAAMWRGIVGVSVFMIGVLYFVLAPVPDDRVTLEAKSYLTPCPDAAIGAPAPACAAVGATFVARYRAAFDGDLGADKDVFMWLMEGRDGLPRNPTQGCAWATVWFTRDGAHVSVARFRDLRVICAAIGEDGWSLAQTRAAQLLAEIGHPSP